MYSAFISETNPATFMNELNVAKNNCRTIIMDQEYKRLNLVMKIDYKPIVIGKNITYTAVVYC